MPATISATDLRGSDDDQLPENNLSTDLSDDQLIYEVITSKPLPGQEYRSIVVSDHLIDHFSEKIENQNVSDCVEFICSAVEAAAKFVKFAADQVATLYTEFSDRTALAPNLAKILLAAERKGGAITVRDAQFVFASRFRPSTQITRLWFNELVALGYGRVKKSGKTLIFENTPSSVPHFPQMTSNPLSSNLSATEESEERLPHFLQTSALTEESEEQLRNEVRKPKPLQEEGLRATEESEELFETSEKIENQNVTDCVKFIRTANFKTAPKLNFEFGSGFKNKFLLVSI
jgi:hypothetical protein